MDRRAFLKSSSLASTALFMPRFLHAFDRVDLRDRRILVVLQLSGGNDGLNTFIPFEDDIYYQNRPSLAIRKDEALPVTDLQGLHPSLASLRPLFDEGLISVVNAVGYPNPDRSHFRSMDIWQSGKVDERVASGWLGRYLDSTCHNCRPHAAIEIGQSLSIAVQGAHQKALVVESPERLTRSVGSAYHAFLAQQAPSQVASDLDYLYKTVADTRHSAAYLQERLQGNRAGTDYPAGGLGKDLRTVANLILSGCDTRIYYLSLSGFDTHVNQSGAHARLLKQVGDSIAAFVGDLRRHDLMRDVTLLCFSEFGRRVEQNGSRGTDHGAGNNLFVIGAHLSKPGFFNAPADLSHLDDGDVRYQIDFRSVYADVLRDWFKLDPTPVLGKKMTPAGMFS